MFLRVQPRAPYLRYIPLCRPSRWILIEFYLENRLPAEEIGGYWGNSEGSETAWKSNRATAGQMNSFLCFSNKIAIY
jgi:hypothetical protein